MVLGISWQCAAHQRHCLTHGEVGFPPREMREEGLPDYLLGWVTWQAVASALSWSCTWSGKAAEVDWQARKQAWESFGGHLWVQQGGEWWLGAAVGSDGAGAIYWPRFLIACRPWNSPFCPWENLFGTCLGIHTRSVCHSCVCVFLMVTRSTVHVGTELAPQGQVSPPNLNPHAGSLASTLPLWAPHGLSTGHTHSCLCNCTVVPLSWNHPLLSCLVLPTQLGSGQCLPLHGRGDHPRPDQRPTT